MRSNGVPRYPDPNSSNETPSGLPKVSLQQLGVSGPQFEAAKTACAHLLPNGGRGPSQSATQQTLSKMVEFARCMRSHGVTNWPDPVASTPTAVALGAPRYMFQLEGLRDLDGRSFSSQITTAMSKCQHQTGTQVPYSG
jgi:hypothetical protein